MRIADRVTSRLFITICLSPESYHLLARRLAHTSTWQDDGVSGLDTCASRVKLATLVGEMPDEQRNPGSRAGGKLHEIACATPAVHFHGRLEVVNR